MHYLEFCENAYLNLKKPTELLLESQMQSVVLGFTIFGVSK